MLAGIKLVQHTHTAPYNAGIEPVWYSEEKQNNANKNQTGTKYTMVLTILV